jgi:predicted transcriptional regulator
MTRHVTVELTDAQAEVLDSEAAREDRPIEAIIAGLIQRQVDYELRFRAAVEEGRAAVERGDTLSHDEVIARGKVRAAKLLGDPKAQ